MGDRLEAAVRELVAALRDELAAAAPAEDAPPRLLSVREARQALGGMAESTIYGLIGEGRLRVVKVGRRTLVPSSSIAAIAAERSARNRA